MNGNPFPGARSDLVRQILENLLSPERLDEHPWTASLFVQAAAAEEASLREKSPGQQLTFAVGRLFREFMPGTPPRRGKRLDTRWGEFGILASQYFAPFLFGTPSPASLRDAWGRIDQVIRLFLDESLPEREISRYRLVSDELEVAPNSTISDWHRKGIERFTEMLVEREKHLSLSLDQPSVVLHPQAKPAQPDGGPVIRTPKFPPRWGRAVRWMVSAGLVLLILLAGIKTWKVYRLVEAVRGDISQLQVLVSGAPSLDQLDQVGPLLDEFSQDLGDLRAEAAPALRLFGPALAWLPVYGPDLASAADLLEMADGLVASAQTAYLAAAPILERVQPDAAPLTPAQLTMSLAESQDEFSQARQQLDQALAIRGKIESESFSPRTRALMDRLDPMLIALDDGLSMLTALPAMLGATNEGPKTYLVLIQNEDELRATGGFITSVGSFVIRDGELLTIRFDDSYTYEDWRKAYPAAPWQLEQYMSLPVLLLRDANWFSDYPTSVSMVEYLYAYHSNHSVDGIIAIDQQALVIFLQAIGPVKVAGVSDPVTAGNVIAYMRAAKIPPPGVKPVDWDRKAFIGQMASVIIEKLLSGDGVSWEALVRALLRALNERHLLLQFDDPQVERLVSRRRWDGAVRAEAGDFLMVVDSNVGYSKGNAVVAQKLYYHVDLSDLSYPQSALVVSQNNRAPKDSPCGEFYQSSEQFYPINRCYLGYLRVYVPDGSRLIEATPHPVPAGWTPNGLPIPARVDLLDEVIVNVRGYGTLIGIPGGQTLSTSFRFVLPPSILATDSQSGGLSYRLKIQKQPGTRAIPVTLRITLPGGAQVWQASPGLVADADGLLLTSTLVTDLDIEIVFSLP